ncbi:MAG: hypothetical protein IJ511_09265 [Bacteroides sp.]|nr:hypothetical protein [Bacteroides sp.]
MDKKAFTCMENYEAPRVEVVEVEVERGYADSLSGTASDTGDDYEFGERS